MYLCHIRIQIANPVLFFSYGWCYPQQSRAKIKCLETFLSINAGDDSTMNRRESELQRNHKNDNGRFTSDIVEWASQKAKYEHAGMGELECICGCMCG